MVSGGVMNVGEFIAQQLVHEVVGAAADRAVFMYGRAEARTLFELLIGPAGFPFAGEAGELLPTFITPLDGLEDALGCDHA